MSSQKRSHDGSSAPENNNSRSKRLRRSSSINNSQNINRNFDLNIRNGKIRMVVLENFMCHQNLKFEFDKRINFIVGSNGSGKSAIMTAIVLAFGGNARLTNRSTKIQSFIKSGENSAKIVIELENSGPMGYKADVYGDKITITRTIRIMGSSTYTLKDSHGNVVSTKLDDLRQVILYFSIRIENPIFMLNQDRAREFLRELEPKKNYELFLKASQFDVIMDCLSTCKEYYTDQKNQLVFLNDLIEIEKAEEIEMAQKLELSKNVKTMKDRIKVMKISYVWCSVVILEKDIMQLEEIIRKVEKQSKSLSNFAISKEILTDNLKTQLTEQNNVLAELQKQYNANYNEFLKAKDEINRINVQLRSLKSTILSHEKRVEYEKADLRQLDSHLQNIDDNKNKVDELMKQNQQKIQKLIEKHEENKVVMDNAKRDLEMLRNNLEQMREKRSELKQETDNYYKQINNITGLISTLKVDTCNKLAIYGKSIVPFVKDIQEMYRQGKFSEMPRGPAGIYIKVPNERFRSIVEHVLKSRLNSFIVNTKKDSVTLNELIKNKYPHLKIPIITTKFTKAVYDITNGRVKSILNTTVLIDEINCSDPVVMNLLIDTLRIETILITDSKSLAEELTKNLENVLPNLSRVMVPNLNLEYVSAPHYAMYSQKIAAASLLQVDVNDRIRQLTIEKNEAEQKAKNAQNSFKEINQILANHELKYREKRLLIEKRDQSIRQILDEKEELENFVYPHVPDFVILQNEYKEKETKIIEYEKKLSNEKQKLDEILNEKNERVQNLEEFQNSFQEHECKTQQQTDECNKILLELRNVDYTVTQNERKLKEINDILITKKAELQAKQNEYEKKKTLALAKGEYLPTDRTEEDLLREIKTLQVKIEKFASLNIDPDQLAIQLAQRKEHLEEKHYKVMQIKESVSCLSDSYTNRFNFLKRLQRHVAACISHVFKTICKYRNINGNLDIDHEERTIHIEVTPRSNEHQSGSRLTTTRVLSGGERSFTTVALLIALWSATEHPFYFLDEYDVFTDEINRHYITKVLIQEGIRNPLRQYFFLTPQDTTIDEQNEAIKIHKLAAPVRD